MNKTKIAALTLAAVLSSAPVFAAEVPKEAVPAYLTEESVCIGKALKTCRKYLTWIQNSVFEGEISVGNLKKLKAELKRIMDAEYDSAIIYTFQSLKYSEKEIMGCERNAPTVFY